MSGVETKGFARRLESGQDRKMAERKTGRLRHLQEIAVVPLWRLGVYILAEVVGTALTWRDLLISPADQKRWGLTVLPHWDWGWWVVGSAAVVIATLFEHSYRVRRLVEGERDAALAETSDLRVREVNALERQADELGRANDRTGVADTAILSFVGTMPVSNSGGLNRIGFIVKVRASGKGLENCQLQIWAPRAGDFADDHNYSYASAPFSLRQGEARLFDVLTVDTNRLQQELKITNFEEKEGGVWKRRDDFHQILAGNLSYDVYIRVIAGNAAPSMLHLKVHRGQSGWEADIEG